MARDKAVQSLMAAQKAVDFLLKADQPLHLGDPRVIQGLVLIQQGLDAGTLWITGQLFDEQDARAYGEYS